MRQKVTHSCRLKRRLDFYGTRAIARYVQMRALPTCLLIFVSLVQAGCSTQLESRTTRCLDDSKPNATLTRVSAGDGYTVYRLTNNDQCALTYFHWLAQGAEPVAYCRTDEGRVWICATTVYGMEGVDGKFYELPHETLLHGRRSVSFQARDARASDVGVRFWSYAENKEVMFWQRVRRD